MYPFKSKYLCYTKKLHSEQDVLYSLLNISSGNIGMISQRRDVKKFNWSR